MADALSRKTEGEVVLNSLISQRGTSWEDLDQEIGADKEIQQILQEVQTGSNEHLGFTVNGGKLVYKGRIVIPRKSTLIAALLHEYHGSAVGGHAGELQTYLRLAVEWYWRGTRKDVAVYVQGCSVCQQQKVSQQSPSGCFSLYRSHC